MNQLHANNNNIKSLLNLLLKVGLKQINMWNHSFLVETVMLTVIKDAIAWLVMEMRIEQWIKSQAEMMWEFNQHFIDDSDKDITFSDEILSEYDRPRRVWNGTKFVDAE